MQFNETLALLRKSRGFTQEQLAEQLGVSRQAIARWESGETAPDVYILRVLSEIFGISADNLLNGVDETPPPAAAVPSPEPAAAAVKEPLPLAAKLVFGAVLAAILAASVVIHLAMIRLGTSWALKPVEDRLGESAAPKLSSLSRTSETEFWTADEYEKWADEQLEIYREKFESGEKILWHTDGGDVSRALTEEDLESIEKALSEALSAIKSGDLFTKDEAFFWTDDSGKTCFVESGEVFVTAASGETTVCETDDFRMIDGPAGTVETVEEVSSAQGTAEKSGQTFEEIFAKYTKFGLKYVETDGKRSLYFNGKAVGKFIDESPDGGIFVFIPDAPGPLTVRTEYDVEGSLSGLSAEE